MMRLPKKLIPYCGAVMLLLAGAQTPAAAEVVAPDVLLEQTVQTLLTEFTARRAELKNDQKKLFALVERIVVPLFDFPRIAKLVLSKEWKTATAAQRAEFTKEFKKLLIGTYAVALFEYTGNEKIAFKDATIRDRGKTEIAHVKSAVALSSTAPPITVEYWLRRTKTADADWKIYNISINGLNMVANYRGTYGASVASLGLQGLIESMRENNAKKF